jgi:hypothetical protein
MWKRLTRIMNINSTRSSVKKRAAVQQNLHEEQIVAEKEATLTIARDTTTQYRCAKPT